MAQRMDVRVGMGVKSKDGHRLGRVIGLAADAFVVEKGVFYARDYRVPFRDVETIEGDDILLSLDKDQLRKASLGEVLEAADRMNLGTDSLSEARMDSAKFQDHGQYDVRPKGERKRRCRARSASIRMLPPTPRRGHGARGGGASSLASSGAQALTSFGEGTAARAPAPRLPVRYCPEKQAVQKVPRSRSPTAVPRPSREM